MTLEIFKFVLTVVFLLFVHWFADFYSQTDKMAQNKSTSNKWLGIHCLTYSFILFVASFNLTFTLINGILHFAIDYCTSRVNKKLWAENRVHDFFVSVGFDQFLHVSILIATFFWLAK